LVPAVGTDLPLERRRTTAAAGTFSFDTHDTELCKATATRGVAVLVITRKPGESLRISGVAHVIVFEVQPGRVKIGIDAPKTTEVWREEIVRQGVRRPPLARR